MDFLAPLRLWLLLLVAAVAALYVLAQARRKRYAVRFTNLSLLASIAPRRPGWRRHLPAAAFLIALAALVTAFARPQQDVKVPRERATVVLAIDVSNSMLADDVKPSRIAAAQSAASAFVDQLPARVNLGLVAFSGSAQVLVSPTTDRPSVKQGIASLRLGPQTAIGEAIFASLSTIARVTSEPGQDPAPGRIVLMSDGATNIGRSNAAAGKAAADAQVPVSTIAYGTDHGTVTLDGQVIDVSVDRQALQDVAKQTAGKFYEAGSSDQLRDVYRDLGSSIGYTTEKHEVTSWFVGLSLLALAAAATGSLWWMGRLP